MALIDDRGRVFGRINLIDLALLVFVALLLPLGYGAYLLFRQPPPQIIGITPNPVMFKSGEQRVRVTGENLRPFMKATLGSADAKGFLVERPTSAELVFTDLPVGTYDLTLFDASQEIARKPNALTIAAPPAPPLQIVGRFVGPTATGAALNAGAKIGDRGSVEIVSVGPPVNGERPATLRTACDSAAAPCVVAGSAVEIGKPIALAVPGSTDPVSFVVDRTRIDGTWLDVQVRLFGIAEVIDLVAAGDVDHHLEPEAPNPTGATRGAVVVSLEKSQLASGAMTLNFTQVLSDLAAFQGNATGTGYLPLHTRAAVLRVPVQRTPAGWRYRDEAIRAGGGVTIETDHYLLRGVILRVVAPDTASADRSDR